MNTLFTEPVKAWVICRTVDDQGVRLQNPCHLKQALFKQWPVPAQPYATGHRADSEHAVVRVTVKAIVPSLLSAPANIADHWDAEGADPVAEGIHSVEIPQLQRFWEVGIGGEVRRNDSGEMADDFQRLFWIQPDAALLTVELLVIDEKMDEGVNVVVIVATAHLVPVDALGIIEGDQL